MEIDTPVLALIGAAVVVAAVIDLVWTTLAVGAGRGPLANRVAEGVYHVGRSGSPSHRRLEVLGVVVAVAVPATWVLLAWCGFALMFLADDDAVLVAASQGPVGALGRIAYAAGSLAGAGASLAAGTETWVLVNNVAAITGLTLVTLSMTYLFQVVTAVAGQRAGMSQIAALGSDPVDAVRRALSAPGLGTLPLQLVSVADAVSLTAQRHLALPMLQFFHSGDHASSVALNLARLDEILTILEHGTAHRLQPTIAAGHGAVEGFLGTLRLSGDDPDPPPPPSLARLREVTDDVVDDAVFAERVAEARGRRARLHAFVVQEGWEWQDVVPAT